MLRSFSTRSFLFVPANNARALEKARTLPADAVVFDLEDSVPEAHKAEALQTLTKIVPERGFVSPLLLIRVPALASGQGAEMLRAAALCKPDGIVLPKVEAAETIAAARAIMGASGPFLAAMIETPKGILAAPAIAAQGAQAGLGCLMVGLNDIMRTTGLAPDPTRAAVLPWLMQIVLAAKAAGIAVIDSVYNAHADLSGFDRECRQAAALGFDGKALIHPGQIAPAHASFTPSPAAQDWACKVLAAFADEGPDAPNVVSIDGVMAERLHVEIAREIRRRAVPGQ